jgi:hypothetical protein
MDVLSIDATSAAASAAAPSAPPPSELAQPSDPGPTAGVPAFPTSPATPQGQHQGDETLHSALSQLVGNGAQVSVQFRVVHDPNEIVTVFTNAQTGQVITQFPPESMVLIAQFFNKLAGAVLDQSA